MDDSLAKVRDLRLLISQFYAGLIHIHVYFPPYRVFLCTTAAPIRLNDEQGDCCLNYGRRSSAINPRVLLPIQWKETKCNNLGCRCAKIPEVLHMST